MPRDPSLKSILVIGSGPIVIGQACEFDYSGVQAVRALKEEGLRVVLLNPNPATVMTEPGLCDATYLEPLRPWVVRRILEREQVDGVLTTLGGQTALNLAVECHERGIWQEFGVRLLGADVESIRMAEDRELFRHAMESIGLPCSRGMMVHNVEDGMRHIAELGYPVILRPSFTLGGEGGGIANNDDEARAILEHGIRLSPVGSIQVEESLVGWKEFELEVIRDNADNGIMVCSIENVDPMGVHTGDSITVAPAQTLTDKEYQRMRDASIAVLRKIGVECGGSNVQFAVSPEDGRLLVIEMNPRVSRSSALASKATGFPIAKVAAKLAVGYTLDELRNEITGGATPASFEPSIDYVVTKVPRFAFEKFPQANDRLTTQMKSVGEVMAIGRTQMESLQKALRGLETGVDGLDEKSTDKSEIVSEMGNPGAERLFYVADAFRIGMTQEEVFNICKIDPWFLAQIEDIVRQENALRGRDLASLSKDELYTLKRNGFSDRRLATLLDTDQHMVRTRRWELAIHPVYKRVDTCAAEFATATAYLYSSYEEECEAQPTERKKIMVLGGGPNRIGQGIEFDYCCVHAAQACREDGYETIMVNCNPETVSTDYDTSDRLYFEPLTLEDVLEIVRIEKPVGVIVQYGGQTPLKLARDLEKNGVPIIGTTPDMIDAAEDRERFQKMLHGLGLLQPPNRTARTEPDAIRLAAEIGYPLVVRPSYVLGGRAMEIVHEEADLQRYMREAVKVSNDSPVLLDRFLNDAIEVDVDALSDGTDVLIGGIMEHIEQAGVHSGDSACSLPPYSLSARLQDELRRQTVAMAKALNVVGLMNVQFAIKGNDVYVLEVNPRASRTVPFVSKATGRPLAKIAARCMTGRSLKDQGAVREVIPPYYSVKEAVFPFRKFPGVDPILGPEMKSTGEVMGVAERFGEAFLKAQYAASVSLPKKGSAFISVRDNEHPDVVQIARHLNDLGFKVLATKGTAASIVAAGLPATRVNKVAEGRPHIVDMIKNQEVQLIVNVVEDKRAIKDSSSIRTAALAQNVPYYTTLAGAEAACLGMKDRGDITVYDLQSLHRRLS